jgi:hypothetical protein
MENVKGYRLRGMGFDYMMNANLELVAQYPNVSDTVALEVLEGENIRQMNANEIPADFIEAGWSSDQISVIY